MITVRLFCANGFSTAMMCKKIQEEAKLHHTEYDVQALPYSKIAEEGKKADVILLGPQIRYNLKKAQALYPEIPVLVLDMQMYGRMDGKSVYELIQKELENV